MDSQGATTSEPRGAIEEANFIANMRRLREENGWSQGELAQRMQGAGWTEFHQTTISRMEKGARPVRLGEARGIAGVLGTLVGQMILDEPAARSLRELELSVQELRAKGVAAGTAVWDYLGFKSVIQYELDQQPTLGEDADDSIRERQGAVIESARQALRMSYGDYIDAMEESMNGRVVHGGEDISELDATAMAERFGRSAGVEDESEA
ncbi:MAG: helix-turn-helix transcriptional regulator [Brachybacterium sp.]|uniref:helix-turn-helix domain-containing protein n=1 Tax=Brachybacterium sp. TaxID=1891286 RepID=UPI002647DAA8|nr:helix-turn-helix transcriptional regulator [Brachybacterium sp.]MDN5688753.1 helix-turn-helix transcriptional regulator [Brachybacterium sp.]